MNENLRKFDQLHLSSVTGLIAWNKNQHWKFLLYWEIKCRLNDTAGWMYIYLSHLVNIHIYLQIDIIYHFYVDGSNCITIRRPPPKKKQICIRLLQMKRNKKARKHVPLNVGNKRCFQPWFNWQYLICSSSGKTNWHCLYLFKKKKKIRKKKRKRKFQKFLDWNDLNYLIWRKYNNVVVKYPLLKLHILR